MSNPFQVVDDFEQALCDYTGARFAVTTNSCTMALLLAVAWYLKAAQEIDEYGVRVIRRLVTEGPRGPERARIEIPRHTYVSVPMSIIHAGGRPTFRTENWRGAYQLSPLPVYDSARRFTSGMYRPGQMQCVSFHATKILGDTQGGAILHDDPVANAWLRRARFDGRSTGIAPKDDRFNLIGWHCYMSPDVAARLLLKLSVLPRHNDDLPNSDYPDLSAMEIFE